MKHKRLFTLLLALCLILSMVPTNAAAAELTAPAPDGEIMGRVNPMVGDVPAAAARGESAELNSGETVTAKKFHSTVDPAAAEVRAAMVARQPSVVIGLTKQAYSTSLLYEIMDKTLAHTGVPNEGDYLTCNGLTWEAYPYESSAGISVEFKITYITSADNEAQMDAAVDALLAELNLWNASDYDKIKGVYDWICTNVAYDYGLQGGVLSYSAYSALVNRTAEFQGYASLFYRLMLELGVDCRVIIGKLDGGVHAWNIVKLNGVYYNVDPTVDAIYRQADMNYCYFLVGDLNFLDHIADYDYTSDEFVAAYPKAEYNYDDSNDIGIYGYCGAEGEYGENLTWYIEDGVLVIYGTGAMADWHGGNPRPWDAFAHRIIGIYVDEGVTYISPSAFTQMYALREVYLANTIKTVANSSFMDCQSLQWIHLPEGLTAIEDYAFYNCFSLQEIEIPDTVTAIGHYAFAYSGLTEITIPAGVTMLSYSCLLECRNLTSVILPEGLLTLDDSALESCSNLTSVTLPESLERIEGMAFCGSGLTSIMIPKNVSYIGYWAFLDAPVETISFTGNAPEFQGNAFYNITATVYYPAGNETWTEEVRQQHGGTITWKAACEEHDYDHDIKPYTCTEDGFATHTCSTCGLTYDEVLPAAHTYTNDQDTICDVCSCVRHIEAEYPENPSVVHMFRLYDPNSGEHFYTGSTEERDYLVSVGWNYEGVGFSFPVVGAPVYRLYDPVYGEHMYTMDIDEVNYLIGEGWNNEGIAFNTAPETEVPQYRLHNPNETRGAYHFTSSTEERDNLLAVGWEYQGIGWYSCWK